MVMLSVHICVGGLKLENYLIMYLHVTETNLYTLEFSQKGGKGRLVL